tara:strand:+ start:3682 stop:4212 length:531 start_codon:yes stop_codon:yes gene_type:complete
MAACQTTDATQAQIDGVQVQRDAYAAEADELREDVTDLTEQVAALTASLEDAATPEEVAATQLQIDTAEVALSTLDLQIEAFESHDRFLKNQQETLVKLDQDKQADGWLMLAGSLITALIGGGVISKTGPSRGKAEIESLNQKIDEKQEWLEKRIEAFERGLAIPTIPTNPTQPPG